jgi:hypothetical protein
MGKDMLSNQQISVSGVLLGHKFNKNSMGYRVVVRTVRNIVYANEAHYGEVQIKGFACRVRRKMGWGIWEVIDIASSGKPCTEHSPDPNRGNICSWCLEAPTRQ